MKSKRNIFILNIIGNMPRRKIQSRFYPQSSQPLIPRFLILCLLVFFSTSGLFAQPYHDTYVLNLIVEQNSYLKAIVDTNRPPLFNEARINLPQPVWPSRQDVINCYWKTWEIAFSNLKQVIPGSGFVSPFIDPAFNDNIFMWDCTFMTMYGKYAIRAFNFQNTLDNFYAKQHPDGFICRQIRESDGTDCFGRFDPTSTGPDIMPWSEWEYFMNFNDTARLAKVFPPLLAYYQWYRTYRSWPDGSYYSSGWGCGMDNQPRLPEGQNFDPRFSTGFMSWIDITLQEIFAGKILIRMSEVLGRRAVVKDIEKGIETLTTYVQQNMWDEKSAFFYDRFRDGTLSGVKSIAAFWSLLAGVVPPENTERFVAHLENPDEFARGHRVPTLSADSPDFVPDGGYWRGAVWAPTNYMIVRGLTNYGKDSLAYEIALNNLNNVVKVYNQTGTLWENYAPDFVLGTSHKDFVGWTGLTPINILFEYVFGIRPNVPDNTILIDVRLTDEYGVKSYPYGKNGLLNILCKKRGKETDKPSVLIQTNVPLEAIVRWSNGEFTKEIKPGKTNL